MLLPQCCQSWLEALRPLPGGDTSDSPACHHQAVTGTNLASVCAEQGDKPGNQGVLLPLPQYCGQAGHRYQPCHGWHSGCQGLPYPAKGLPLPPAPCRAQPGLLLPLLLPEPLLCPVGHHISPLPWHQSVPTDTGLNPDTL